MIESTKLVVPLIVSLMCVWSFMFPSHSPLGNDEYFSAHNDVIGSAPLPWCNYNTLNTIQCAKKPGQEEPCPTAANWIQAKRNIYNPYVWCTGVWEPVWITKCTEVDPDRCKNPEIQHNVPTENQCELGHFWDVGDGDEESVDP